MAAGRSAPAAAQTPLEIGAGMTAAVVAADDVWTTKGLDVRVAGGLNQQYRLEAMFAAPGGHAGDRLLGVQLARTTSSFRDMSTFTSTGLIGFLGRGHASTAVFAQGGGVRVQLNDRVSLRNEFQFLFPAFGIRASMTAGLRLGR